METNENPGRAKRRKEQRLSVVRRRAAVASALGFAAFLGLAAQHAVGSTKRAAKVAVPQRATTPTRYFDQQGGGFAFDDGSAEPLPAPVAQTSVS